jgi:hypothetical protein
LVGAILSASALSLSCSSRAQQKKREGIKMSITQRMNVPSQLPWQYVSFFDPSSDQFILDKKDVSPKDFLVWAFYGGTLDRADDAADNRLFFFALNPSNIPTMMDDLEGLDSELIRKIDKPTPAVLVGPKRLAKIKKVVGDRVKLTSINHEGIDFEVQIIGELPNGKYDDSAIINLDFLAEQFRLYETQTGRAHPNVNKFVSFIWLRVADRATYDRIAKFVDTAPQLADCPVGCHNEEDLLADPEMKRLLKR